MAILLNIPKFLEAQFTWIPIEKNNTTNNDVMEYEVGYKTTELRDDPNYIQIYINWIRLITTGIIPMGALIYFNFGIFRGIQVRFFGCYEIFKVRNRPKGSHFLDGTVHHMELFFKCAQNFNFPVCESANCQSRTVEKSFHSILGPLAVKEIFLWLEFWTNVLVNLLGTHVLISYYLGTITLIFRLQRLQDKYNQLWLRVLLKYHFLATFEIEFMRSRCPWEQCKLLVRPVLLVQLSVVFSGVPFCTLSHFCYV